MLYVLLAAPGPVARAYRALQLACVDRILTYTSSVDERVLTVCMLSFACVYAERSDAPVLGEWCRHCIGAGDTHQHGCVAYGLCLMHLSLHSRGRSELMGVADCGGKRASIP